ncbi:tyrosine-type recombinase/integrase [Paenibacillus xylanilyticus]|uniref:tyrosine-type recombinase/integrase n=1 Tax=Paenibacillus xylanilyticus TaxID=248903 RepID=UPI003AAFB70A
MDKRTGKRYQNGRKTAGAQKDLGDLYEIFRSAKISEGRSYRTIEKYDEAWRRFSEFLNEEGLERTATAVTPVVVRSYIAWLMHGRRRFADHPHKSDAEKTVGVTAVTANTIVNPIKTMFRFLHAEELIDTNPCANVKKIKEAKKEIKIMSVDDMKLLLAMPDKRSFVGFRDFVIMNVLIDTMARINEVLNARRDDVDLVKGFLHISETTAKSRRGRAVPIQRRTVQLLKDLMKECDEFDTEYLFTTNYGGPLRDDRFRDRLKGYVKAAGIETRVHPHLFRHTGATLFLQNGGNERYLAEILGHADLRMVAKYTHLSNEDVKEKHIEFSPLNNVTGPLEKPRKSKR